MATRSSDSEVDGVDLALVNNPLLDNGDWEHDLDDLLALDFLLDRYANRINWKSIDFLLIVKSKGATLLPWPERVVADFDFFEDDLTWNTFNDFFWLLVENGSEFIPRFAFLVELLLLLIE